jgi:hypothetical protein
MVGIPKYVSEGSIRKYNRALVNLVAVNTARKVKGEAEIDVKGLYELYGGLVLAEPTVDEEVVEEAPVKKGKK